jgi:hypothetical protein
LPSAVAVRVIQDGLWGDTRILSESEPSRRESAERAVWTVNVPANGEAELTATFDTRF